MNYSTPYLIPESPPAEAARRARRRRPARSTRSLARAAQLTLGMDEQTRGLRIDLDDGDESRRLTPTQLFDLLATG